MRLFFFIIVYGYVTSSDDIQPSTVASNQLPGGSVLGSYTYIATHITEYIYTSSGSVFQYTYIQKC